MKIKTGYEKWGWEDHDGFLPVANGCRTDWKVIFFEFCAEINPINLRKYRGITVFFGGDVGRNKGHAVFELIVIGHGRFRLAGPLRAPDENMSDRREAAILRGLRQIPTPGLFRVLATPENRIVFDEFWYDRGRY